MLPNKHVVLEMDFLDDAQDVVSLPKGTLFDVAINPYNGRIIFSWQDNPQARFFSKLILDQLASYDYIFDEIKQDSEVLEYA